MVAGESAGKSPMHSSMERRGGTGLFTTATGGVSGFDDHLGSGTDPGHSPAKSRAASVSEMWITAMLPMIVPWS